MAFQKILLTGIAGFIGVHVGARLLQDGYQVVGVDNLNDFYDVELKRARLRRLGLETAGFTGRTREPFELSAGRLRFFWGDLGSRETVERIFAAEKPDAVIHLAAQAGVRYSLENPRAYIDSNIVGFLNLLEGCRHHAVGHLVYASSSAVYGGNQAQPFSVHQPAEHPLSLYAATKKADELMAHAYAHLFGIPVTGLRFFTVYGPWNRPDMAISRFTRSILEGRPIELYNQGRMKRDFTYVDDIVEGVVRVLERVPAGDPGWDALSPDPAGSRAPYRLFNIGHNRPIDLLAFIEVLERNLGRRAEKVLLPLQSSEVPETCADIDDLRDWVGYSPRTAIEAGVPRFLAWYREYYGV